MRAEGTAVTDLASAKIDPVVVQVFPLDAAKYARQLNMAPAAVPPHMRRQVRPRQLRLNALQLDTVGKISLVGACAWFFEADRDGISSLQWHPSELNITEPDKSVRPPIFKCVRVSIGIAKDRPVLSGAEVAKFAVRMSYAKDGFAGIGS